VVKEEKNKTRHMVKCVACGWFMGKKALVSSDKHCLNCGANMEYK